MAGYIRQSTFVDGDTITAALFNNEYNQLVNAFSNTSGHKHDGTTAEGPVIGLIGDAGETSPNNKVLIDTTNNYIEFYVEVSSAPVQQLYIADGAIIPVTDNDIDLGTSSLEFKNIYIDGTATIDTLTVDEAATVGTTLGVTGATTLSSTLGVTGATTLSSTLAVTGATTLSSTLAVTGTSTLTGNVTTTNDLSVGGNLTVTGNATISGNLTFGDADTDSINLSAEIDSHIIPNTSNTYDLGTATKQWRNIFSAGTLHADAINFNGTAITSTAAELNILDGVTSTAAELNLLDGVTSTTAELNILDGVTSTATEINIVDGDTAATSTTLADADRVVVNDNGTMVQVALTDFETYFEGALDTLSNVTTVGALNAGSITSGFGSIDNGSSAITTTGTVTYGSLSDGTITITAFADEDDMSSDSATLVPTQQSVKAYVDSQVTAQDLDFQGDSGGALSIDLDSETLTIAGGTGIDTTGATNTLTVAIDSTVATLTGSQTLTNKTLTTPVISSISNTGTLTLPTSTDTLVGRATTDTLTNKTLTTPIISSISNTGTLTLPTSTDTLVGRATTDTLTNKTLTSPVINTGVSGTAILDEDNMASDSATQLATQQSIKAYVDAQVGGVGGGDVVDDTTPQLGGDLDLNSNDITGTGDINITGTVTASDLEIDSGTLSVDSTNNRVGIGTTSPLGTLHVNGDIIADANANNGFGFERSGVAYSMLEFGATSADELSLFNKVNNDLVFGTNSTERARIDNAGNFGLGTDSPDTIMEIVGADPILTIRDTDTGQSTANARIRFAESAGGDILDNYWDVGLEPTQSLTFSKNGTEYARFNTNGNLGIGTTSPARLLHISGTDSTQLELEQTSASDDVRMLLDAGGTSGQIQFAGASHSSVPNTLSLVSAADTRFVQAGQTVMHIDSASGGQVIIGGTAALGSATFTVDSNSAAIACFDGSSANGGYLQFRNNNTAKGVLGFGSNAGASSTDAMILGSTSGNVEFHANNAEAMRIDTSGNVGIGTSSPDGNLEVVTSTVVSGASDTVNNVLIGLQSANRPTIILDTADTTYTNRTWNITNNGASGHLTIGRNGLDVMTLKNDGLVGIGTTSPDAPLHVEATNASVVLSDSGRGQWWRIQNEESTDSLRIVSNDVNERMRINSSGQVGIACTDQSNLLTVDANSASSTTDSISVRNRGVSSANHTTGLRFQFSAAVPSAIRSRLTNTGNGAGTLSFYTSADGSAVNLTERMTIDSSGNVGIGTTSATGKFEVVASSVSGGVVKIQDTDSTVSLSNTLLGLYFPNDDDCTNATFLGMYDSGSRIGSITVTNATSVAFNTTSDERLKENIVDASSKLNLVKDIQVREFDWKKDGRHQVGFIAQELNSLVPEAVTEGGEDVTENPWGVDYGKLTPYLVKAIQEQQAQIEALQSEINELKNS